MTARMHLADGLRESCRSGQRVGRATIANISKENGIDPAPERGTRTTWSQFLKAHWEVLAAADFFPVEVWRPRGLVTFYVFFPADKQFVILDRESKYSAAFRDLLKGVGVGAPLFREKGCVLEAS